MLNIYKSSGKDRGGGNGSPSLTKRGLRAFTPQNAILFYFTIPKNYFINYTISFYHTFGIRHKAFGVWMSKGQNVSQTIRDLGQKEKGTLEKQEWKAWISMMVDWKFILISEMDLMELITILNQAKIPSYPFNAIWAKAFFTAFYSPLSFVIGWEQNTGLLPYFVHWTSQ